MKHNNEKRSDEVGGNHFFLLINIRSQVAPVPDKRLGYGSFQKCDSPSPKRDRSDFARTGYADNKIGSLVNSVTKDQVI